MKHQKKPVIISPAMRTAVILKIAKEAEANPAYKKHVEQRLADVLSTQLDEPQYLTDAHRENSEAVFRQIAINKTLKINWDEEVERQKRNSKDNF